MRSPDNLFFDRMRSSDNLVFDRMRSPDNLSFDRMRSPDSLFWSAFNVQHCDDNNMLLTVNVSDVTTVWCAFSLCCHVKLLVCCFFFFTVHCKTNFLVNLYGTVNILILILGNLLGPA